MFNGSLSDGTTTIQLHDAQEEFNNVARYHIPIANLASRATALPLGRCNSIMVSLEETRASVLVLRSDLDQLDLNADMELTFEIDRPKGSMTWQGLVVAREPQAVLSSNVAGDPDGVWLVELADRRWLARNPWFCISTPSSLYNVSSNASDGADGPDTYLPASLDSGNVTDATNASPIVITSDAHGLATGQSVTITGVTGNTAANGTFTITVIDADTFSLDGSTGNGAYDSGGSWTAPWTWATMAADLWGLMTAQLGDFPGLPFSPNGIPQGWCFQGASAFDALTDILTRIGCAIRADLTQDIGSQFTIIQVGAADAVASNTIAKALKANWKLHDGEFVGITRGKFPYGVAVQFHKVLADPTQIPPWLQNDGPYVVNVVGPYAETAEPDIYHPIWDDMLAVYNSDGDLTNGSDLSSRATERSNDFYRMLTGDGGTLYWQRFTGLLPIAPGSTIKSVSWHGAGAGVYTDVTRHGPNDLPKRDYQTAGTLQDLLRLGLPSDTFSLDDVTITTPDTHVQTAPFTIADGGNGTTTGDSNHTITFHPWSTSNGGFLTTAAQTGAGLKTSTSGWQAWNGTAEGSAATMTPGQALFVNNSLDSNPVAWFGGGVVSVNVFAGIENQNSLTGFQPVGGVAGIQFFTSVGAYYSGPGQNYFCTFIGSPSPSAGNPYLNSLINNFPSIQNAVTQPGTGYSASTYLILNDYYASFVLDSNSGFASYGIASIGIGTPSVSFVPQFSGNELIPTIVEGVTAAIPPSSTIYVAGGIVVGYMLPGQAVAGVVSITENSTNVAANATQLIINGNEFNTTFSDNTLTWSGAASAPTIASNTTTSTEFNLTLTPSFSDVGALQLVVSNSTGSSAPAVTVATIVPAPTLTSGSAPINNVLPITFPITGTGFDPSMTGTITAPSGCTCTITYLSPTSANVTLTAIGGSFSGNLSMYCTCDISSISSGGKTGTETVAVIQSGSLNSPYVAPATTPLSTGSATLDVFGNYLPTNANASYTTSNGTITAYNQISSSHIQLTFSGLTAGTVAVVITDTSTGLSSLPAPNTVVAVVGAGLSITENTSLIVADNAYGYSIPITGTGFANFAATAGGQTFQTSPPASTFRYASATITSSTSATIYLNQGAGNTPFTDGALDLAMQLYPAGAVAGPTQIATAVNVSITSSSASISASASTVTIAGTNFDPANPGTTFGQPVSFFQNGNPASLWLGNVVSVAPDGSSLVAVFNGTGQPTFSNGDVITALVWAYGGNSGGSSGATATEIGVISGAGGGGPTCATPTFSVAGGTYNTAQSIYIMNSTGGAQVDYTTDSSTPTYPNSGTGTAYTGLPVAINVTTTLKAIAGEPGYQNSSVASATYTLQCATPTFSPGAGTYSSTQSVTISCSTPGASLLWGTSSPPTTPYTGAISVSSSETLYAEATKTGWSNSSIASAAYTINTQTVTVVGSGSTTTISTTAASGVLIDVDVVVSGGLGTLSASYNGNAMTQVGSTVSFGLIHQAKFYLRTATANGSVTVGTASGTIEQVQARTISGLVNNTLDTYASNYHGTISPPTTLSATTSNTANANEVALAALGVDSLSGIAWAGSPTFTDDQDQSGTECLSTAHAFVPSSGTAVDASASWTTASECGIIVAVYS